MGDDATSPPRTRRTRAELRELMIEAGAEVLQERGIEAHLASLTYAQVFAHLKATRDIKVTYGSVHERIWGSIAAYQLDVIDRVGIWEPHSRPEADLPAMTSRVIADGPPDHDVDDPQHTLHQALRRLAAHHDPDDDEAWTAWVASATAMATLAGDDTARATTTAAARARYDAIDRHTADGLRATLDRLGLRPRHGIVDGADPVLLAAQLLTTLCDGERLRSHLTDEPMATVSRPGDHDQQWAATAIAMEALVDLLFEPRS